MENLTASQLVNQLQHSSQYKKQLNATLALQAMGSKASCVIPELVNLLAADDDFLPFLAAGVLRKIGEPAFWVLVDYLTDTSNPVRARMEAAFAIEEIPAIAPSKASKLVDLLGSDDYRLRRIVLMAIAKIRPFPIFATGAIFESLRDPDLFVVAAETIGEAIQDIGSMVQCAVPSLVQGLYSRNPYIALVAANTIEKIGKYAASAMPALAECCARNKPPPPGYHGLVEPSSLYKAAKQTLNRLVHSVLPRPARERGAFDEYAGSNPQVAIDCTVFAPQNVTVGGALLTQVFIHAPDEETISLLMAQEFDSDAERRGVTSLGSKISYGAILRFELVLPDLMIDDPIQDLMWRGRAQSVTFAVTVPTKIQPFTIIGKVFISQDAMPIGLIRFKLRIVPNAVSTGTMSEPTGISQRYNMAFISYAAKDRSEVLRRVQMLPAVGIRYFQDVLDLDPGDRWAKELFRHIDESDVMFLFWSSAAKESDWVQKEWKYGLEKYGDDFVLPVIIEGPPVPEPPEQLKHLHFSDKVLYFIKGK